MTRTSARLLLGLAAGLLLTLLPSPAAAQTACGGPGQRGCCVASTERLSTGACSSGLVEVAGWTGNCACGGSGLAVFFGSSSSSTCQAVSSCGGPGERACCITETRWDTNPIPASGGCRFDAAYTGVNGLTEVAGGSGAGILCGGSNPFGLRSNGTCQTCGTEGAHSCVGVPLEQGCQGGLTDVLGFCRTCGGEGQPLCGDWPTYTCAPGFHPDGGSCKADRVIAEPDCNCTPELPASPTPDPTAPVHGYADLHLHMFANLAFGGLTVWGDAFNKTGGVSQALRSDNFAQRTADRVLNGRVIKGVDTIEAVPPDQLRAQTIVHGDLHMDDVIGFGTKQHGDLPFTPALANGGVEWDPNVPSAADLDFAGWPKWSSTTHQQAYYKWLERAHVGGLRLVVLLGVNNEAMCASQKRFGDPEFSDCTDTMAAVKLQFAKAEELEQWLADQCAAGVTTACASNQPAGEKQGWFRIVRTPAEARVAIAKGQLAVVLGIEEASLFGCKAGICTPQSVRTAIDDYYALGVRHIFPIHNFDNGFGGAATWMDTIGIANAYSTGQWFQVNECPQTPAFNGDNGYGFKMFAAAETDFLTQLAQQLSRAILQLGLFYRTTYPDVTTTCNNKGLTGLGDFLVREMMHRKMIIDVDHMSNRAFDQTLNIAEANGYPGIVASHVLMYELAAKAGRHERMRTRNQLQRIARVGGMIGAMTQPPEMSIDEIVNSPEISPSFVRIAPPNSKVVGGCVGSSTLWAWMYEYAVDVMTVDGVKPAIAFGTDFNGISSHNRPRFGDEGCVDSDEASRISYPFTLNGFGSFAKQKTGKREFDFNTQGLAHVGLLPDMVEDLKKVGLADDLDPLFNSAEAYIRMWEKAGGTTVPATNLSNDTTAPATTATQSPAANAYHWNNTNVTVSLNATDAAGGSGVAEILHTIGGLSTVTAGTSVDFVAGQEGQTTIDYAARDLAGNQEVAKHYSVSIDATPPTISGQRTAATAANAAGWNKASVVAEFQCSDTQSSIDTCSSTVTVASEGANQEAIGSALDKAGNAASASVSGINIDKTAPTISGLRSPAANSYGWNRTDVAVSFTCADGLSGVETCSADQVVTAEGADQSREGTATDRAGHTASATVSGIRIDRTPPTIAGSRLPLANAAGWNNTPLTVSFTCNDALSGVAACPATEVLSTNGAAQSRSGTATDKGGNTASATVGGMSIDTVAPTVTITGVVAGAVYTLGSVPTPGCQTADALSGVAASAAASVTGGTANSVGEYRIVCAGAMDVAGNPGSATGTYYVHYPFAGFFQPVDNLPTINRSTAGATIPLKFSLSGNFGLAILKAGSPSSTAVSCESSAQVDEIEETVASSATALTYDAASSQYSMNWRTDKAWKGTCRQLTVSLDDGSTHRATVMFR